MNFSIKYCLLALSYLAVVHSIAAAEKLPEENFEDFRNRGLHEFFDKFSQSHFVDLGFEDPNERQKREEEFKKKEVKELEAKRQEEEFRKQERKEAKRRTVEETRQKLTIAEDHLISLTSQLDEAQKKAAAEEAKRRAVEINHTKAAEEAKKYIENLRKQLEATQKKVDEVEELLGRSLETEIDHLKAKAEAEQQRVKRAEAEQQRIKIQEAEQQRIKIQETMQREKQEKLALWNSGIDKTMQHVKDLNNFGMADGTLLRILQDMEEFIEQEITTHARMGAYGHHLNCLYNSAITLRKHRDAIATRQVVSGALWISSLSAEATAREMVKAEHMENLKLLIEEKMRRYEGLQGSPHPRRDEFSKM